MGRSSTKQLAKRRMARIYNHIDTTINLLATEHALFADTHADLAEQLAMWGLGLLMIQDEIKQFWEENWGPFPDDITSWT